MTICEYCIDTLFKEPIWKPKEKDHHTEVETWQESTKQCTICSCLLDAIKTALLTKMEGDICNMLDTYLRFEPILDTGALGLLKNALPIYSVTLQEFAAKDQFLLIFRPIEANIQKLGISGPFGDVKGLVLPVRKFQVFTTVYHDEEIPRLSNETSLDDKRNPRNKRTLEQVTSWIEKCNSQHSHCTHFAEQKLGSMTESQSEKRKSFVPTRLIDVSPRGLSYDQVCLVETGGRNEFSCYATLRYVCHVRLIARVASLIHVATAGVASLRCRHTTPTTKIAKRPFP